MFMMNTQLIFKEVDAHPVHRLTFHIIHYETSRQKCSTHSLLNQDPLATIFNCYTHIKQNMVYLLLIGFSIVFLVWFYLRQKRMNILAANGIFGPPRHFIFGNGPDLQRDGFRKCFKNWRNKYGKTFGFYNGGHGTIVTSDLDLVKKILVTDFDTFYMRPEGVIPKGSIFIGGGRWGMAMANESWYRQRKILNAAVTPNKIKSLIPIMNEILDETIHADLRRAAKEKIEIDINESFQKATFKTTLRNFFGVSLDFESQSPVAKSFLDGTKALSIHDPISKMMFCFPEFTFMLYPLRMLVLDTLRKLGLTNSGVLTNFAIDVIQKRLDLNKKNIKINDFLQLMIDTEENQKKLTFKEMVGNSFFFMLGGFETTSVTMAYVAHFLINHQDIQDQVREEVQQVHERNGKFDYDAILNMPLLEATIFEALRHHPPAPTIVNRYSIKDYDYGDIRIPKGTPIMVDIDALHDSPQYWNNPDEFDIMRFAEKDSTYDSAAFQGFGFGQRYCIGMRIAMLIMKLSFTHLLFKFKLVPSKNTEIGKLTIDERLVTQVPKFGVITKVEALD